MCGSPHKLLPSGHTDVRNCVANNARAHTHRGRVCTNTVGKCLGLWQFVVSSVVAKAALVASFCLTSQSMDGSRRQNGYMTIVAADRYVRSAFSTLT